MSKEILVTAKEKMTKTEESLRHESGQIRAGRVSASSLDHIQVEYYDTPTSVSRLVSINILEARVSMTIPFDKNLITDTEKAIQMSDIGINSANDGDAIHLVIPQLMEEHRKEPAKDVKKGVENSKVVVRNVRRDTVDELKKARKDGDIIEDELYSFEKDVQGLTDDNIRNIDAITAEKEQGLLEVRNQSLIKIIESREANTLDFFVQMRRTYLNTLFAKVTLG